MSEVRQIPKLRFKDFKEIIINVEVSSIVEFKSGGTPKKDNQLYWNGNIPWISASSMRGKFYSESERTLTEQGLHNGSKLAPKNTLLLLVRGSMLYNKIPVGITISDVAFNQDLKSLIPNEKTNTEYLYQWFCSKENLLLNMVVGTGIGAGKLETDDIKSLKVLLPSLTEQQKIASFLSSVDKKIEQLQQKKTLLEQYKKGVMRKIFSQELRFKPALSEVEGDDGKDYSDWEEKRLGDLLDYEQPTKYIVNSTEYDDSYKIPVLTAGKSFILGYTDENENIFSKFPVIIFDDFTMANKFVDFNFKVKSSAMKILKVVDHSVNLRFVYESIQMINYPKGDEHKRFWISEYSKIKIKYPCKEEQNKIANFLSVIDAKIELVNTQIENTQQFKKGLLQQMFV